MKRRPIHLAALGLVIILSAGLSSCGGTDQPRSRATVPLVPVQDVTTWPDAPFYWRDIAGSLYSDGYRSSYGYDQADGVLHHDRAGRSVFRGQIAAANLKPHFAYQIKLVGKPTAKWGADGNDWANESLGYAGRWWRHQPNPGNATDADYEAHKGDPAYVYEGYLLVDFLVTDSGGQAVYEFASDSSYHVLWQTSQRPPGPSDGPVRGFEVDGETVEIYGEWEPTRALPGQATLPAGQYNVQLVLTEESWHSEESAWAAAVGAPTVQFEIAPPLVASAQPGQ